ncbi:PREDICTED: LOW QUALITY PROTEIN [Prunus dulcis]|uniref:PREDICTED: LOW QUALITY PROTEIN n=1 Tax=Prunus dulcis TaxID=3755 RepID=A0A5E4FMN7_PRUDU|nr:PREDICTED: LOW QUALITY PROTEIN [Prunus dulcis]
MGENEKSTEAAITNTSVMYSLHSSDHSGIILASHILEGDNYGPWSRSTTISLSAKNKIFSSMNRSNLLLEKMQNFFYGDDAMTWSFHGF